MSLQGSGIATHSDGQAWFRQDFLTHAEKNSGAPFIEPKDGFTWSHREGVHALEAVLAVYSQTNPLTDYEHFYDELWAYSQKNAPCLDAPAFVEQYTKRGLHGNAKRQQESKHIQRALYGARLLFPQLVKELLRPDPVVVSPDSAQAYQRLFTLIRSHVPRQSFFAAPRPGPVFCIHTLNHDLLVEDWLNDETGTEAIRYSDGFSELGSPYYGRLDFDADFPQRFHHRPHTAYVRMPRFTGEYNSSVQLLKLHGSLDYWRFSAESGDTDLYGPSVVQKQPWIEDYNLYREVEVNGTHEYRRDSLNYHPLFLSGTTAKLEQYDDPVLFRRLLDQFQANLSDSNILVIIGYGFRDEGINHRILPTLEDTQKKVIVIGRELPDYFPAIKPDMFRTGGLEAYDFTELERLLER